jgi:hypothetical protein
MGPAPRTTVAGERIVRASWVGTGVFAVTAILGVAVPHPLAVPAAVVAFALFAAGCVVFVWAYVVAVARSRTDEISVMGLYLLSGSAPRPVRVRLLGAVGAQSAVALATASARPYTIAAAGILVPVYGLGLCGLWAARYGTFPPRRPAPRRGGSPRR